MKNEDIEQFINNYKLTEDDKKQIVKESLITDWTSEVHVKYIFSCDVAYKPNSDMTPGHYGTWLIVGDNWEGFANKPAPVKTSMKHKLPDYDMMKHMLLPEANKYVHDAIVELQEIVLKLMQDKR